jgi:hypothetical protein
VVSFTTNPAWDETSRIHRSLAALDGQPYRVLVTANPAADQPLLAAQVQALGAGIALDGEAVTPDEIRADIAEVLTESRYRAASQRLAGRVGTPTPSRTQPIDSNS